MESVSNTIHSSASQRLQARFAARSAEPFSLALQQGDAGGGLLATFDAIFQQSDAMQDASRPSLESAAASESSTSPSSDSDSVAPAEKSTDDSLDNVNDRGECCAAEAAAADADSDLDVGDELLELQSEQTTIAAPSGPIEDANLVDAEDVQNEDGDEEHDEIAPADAIVVPANVAVLSGGGPAELDADAGTQDSLVGTTESADGDRRENEAGRRSAEPTQATAATTTVSLDSAGSEVDTEAARESEPTADAESNEEQPTSDSAAPLRRSRRAERLSEQARNGDDALRQRGGNIDATGATNSGPTNTERTEADRAAAASNYGQANVGRDSASPEWMQGMQAVAPYEMNVAGFDASRQTTGGKSSALSMTTGSSPLNGASGAAAISASSSQVLEGIAEAQSGDSVHASGGDSLDAAPSLDTTTEKRRGAIAENGAAGNGATTTKDTSNDSRVRLVQRVSRAFQKLGPDGGRVQIMLHPAELGSVRLNLSVDGNRVEATMSADSEAALSVLKDNLPELKQRLIESGMVIDRMEVELDQSSSHSAAGESGQNARQGHNGSGDDRRWLGGTSSNRLGTDRARSAASDSIRSNPSAAVPRGIRGRLDLVV